LSVGYELLGERENNCHTGNKTVHAAISSVARDLTIGAHVPIIAALANVVGNTIALIKAVGACDYSEGKKHNKKSDKNKHSEEHSVP
jgi:hypothetical protein